MASNPTHCHYPGCSQLAYPGFSYCSKRHRDDAPHLTAQGGVSAAMDTTPDSPPVPPSKTFTSEDEIKFYDSNAPYYEFTNFARYPIFYDGDQYPTSEHLFQSLKFEDKIIRDKIRQQPTPRDAFNEAHHFNAKVRKGWFDEGLNIKTMENILLLKFTQHSKLRKMLLSTGEAKLIEDSPHDPFWGMGADGLGKNQLGLGLMKTRQVLETLERERQTGQ